MNPTMICHDMHYWRMQPDRRLRPWVLCYFLARPAARSALPGPPHEQELLLPDGHSEIVFNVDSRYERWRIGQGGERSVVRESYLIGGRSHSVFTRDLGPVTVAGIKLDPRALRWLIATPLAEFSDATLPLRELNQPLLLELEARVAHSAGAREVTELFDRFLLKALGTMPAPDQAVDRLLDEIRATRGVLPIMRWVHDEGCDARHLERRFCAATGLTPKRYARIVRFKHSYFELLSRHPRSGNRAAPTHLDGFCDQSHFNKEFRSFIGAAPSARLRAVEAPATSISDHLLALELSPDSQLAR